MSVPLKRRFGDVDNQGMRRDGRFTFTALVASLVMVVLAGGLAAAANDGHLPWVNGSARATSTGIAPVDPDSDTTTTALGSTTTTSTPGSTSTTSGPTTTKPSKPGTTTTSTAPSGPVIRSTRDNYGPTDPWAVDTPYSPGRTSWTGTTKGVTISVRVDQARPKAGEPVQFDIELSSTTQACCGLYFLLGDGSIFAERNGWSCPSGGPAGPGTARFRTSHVYNYDGQWTFNVQAITGNCTEPTGTASLFGVIDVAPGTSAAQGPSLPKVELHLSAPVPGHDGEIGWVSVVGEIEDSDGWITHGTLDWGDGTAPQVFETPAAAQCQTTLSGWPTPHYKLISQSEAFHHYVAPGTYVATLTAVTTGCDWKSDPQTGVASFTFRVPAEG